MQANFKYVWLGITSETRLSGPLSKLEYRARKFFLGCPSMVIFGVRSLTMIMG